MRPVDKMKPVRDGRFGDNAPYADCYFAQATKAKFAKATWAEFADNYPKKIAKKLKTVDEHLVLHNLGMWKTNAQKTQFTNEAQAKVDYQNYLKSVTVGNMVDWLNLKQATGKTDRTEYTDSRERLIPEIGGYCSFCERPIKAKLDVEHMAPKAIEKTERFRWRNFLLACGTCNTFKSDRYIVHIVDNAGNRWTETVPLTYCFWPDRIDLGYDDSQTALYRTGPHAQDSFNVFQYEEFGVVRVHPKVKINDGTYDRVLATLTVVELDLQPNEGKSPVSGLWFTSWDGENKTTKLEQPSSWAELDASGFAPPRLMTSTAVNATVPVVRAARNLVNAKAKYHDFKSAVADAKDYRAFHRNEAWQVAERYRRKFDRILPNNQNKKAQWKDEADKIQESRQELTNDSQQFEADYKSYEANKQAKELESKNELAVLNQRLQALSQEQDPNTRNTLGKALDQDHSEWQFQAQEIDGEFGRALQELSTRFQILQYREDELNGLEADNELSWQNYIRQHQDLTDEQWLYRIGQMTKFTLQQAEAMGCWSVWATVFKARGANEAFKIRPAVTPVLEGLLKFPGTVAHDKFNPPLYTSDPWDPMSGLPKSDAVIWYESQKIKEDQSAVDRQQRLEKQRREEQKEQDLIALRMEVQRLRQENQQLAGTNQQLTGTNQQLTTTNQRLTTTNLQLTTSNQQLTRLNRLLSDQNLELGGKGQDTRKRPRTDDNTT